MQIVRVFYIEFQQSLKYGLWDVWKSPFMALFNLCFVMDIWLRIGISRQVLVIITCRIVRKRIYRFSRCYSITDRQTDTVSKKGALFIFTSKITPKVK
jgi:hypothetical protein